MEPGPVPAAPSATPQSFRSFRDTGRVPGRAGRARRAQAGVCAPGQHQGAKRAFWGKRLSRAQKGGQRGEEGWQVYRGHWEGPQRHQGSPAGCTCGLAVLGQVLRSVHDVSQVPSSVHEQPGPGGIVCGHLGAGSEAGSSCVCAQLPVQVHAPASIPRQHPDPEARTPRASPPAACLPPFLSLPTWAPLPLSPLFPGRPLRKDTCARQRAVPRTVFS